MRGHQDIRGRGLSKVEQINVTVDAKTKLALCLSIKNGEDCPKMDNMEDHVHERQ